MSGWLLFNTNSAIFQLYHGENKLILNELIMMSALYLTNRLCWIFIVLAHWHNSPRVDISPHSDTIPCFQTNQSLFPWCCMLIEEATNTNFIVFGVSRSGLELTIYCTQGKHANYYTNDAVCYDMTDLVIQGLL